MEGCSYRLEGSSSFHNYVTDGRLDLHANGTLTGTLHETRVTNGVWSEEKNSQRLEFQIEWGSKQYKYTATAKKTRKGGKTDLIGTWEESVNSNSTGTCSFSLKNITYTQRGLACYGKEDPLFEVLVTTGAMANAETASRVFLRIQGSKDQSTVIRLRDQNAVSVHDPLFQKGRVDTFYVYKEDLGPDKEDLGAVIGVSLSHDNSGAEPPPGGKPSANSGTPGWYCERVAIKDNAAGFWHSMPVERWLDRGLGDGTTSATVETAARAQVVALQEQLNAEARTNAELAAENRRCRALLGNDQRLQELEAEAQRSDAQVAESQGALDRTKAQAEAAAKEAEELKEAAARLRTEIGQLQQEYTELDREREAQSARVEESRAALAASVAAWEENEEVRQQHDDDVAEIQDALEVLKATADAKELQVEEWRQVIVQKEAKLAQVEEECNDVNMELMRCKANLDGMKLDVNMHLEWTEKLRALLAKQTKYAADLTAKLEEIKADVARLEQEKTVAEAGQSQSKAATEKEQRTLAELEATRRAAKAEREATTETVNKERVQMEAFMNQAETQMLHYKDRQELAQANERRLKAEEEALKHASDMLERHNGALAERIVRNEQITHELQRRAKRARQLQKDVHRILEQLMAEALRIVMRKDIVSPVDPSRDLSSWPPVQEVMSFKGRLERLLETFQTSDHILAGGSAATSGSAANATNPPRLQSTNDMLAELWEDNERLTKLRRQHAEADHFHRLRSTRSPSPTKGGGGSSGPASPSRVQPSPRGDEAGFGSPGNASQRSRPLHSRDSDRNRDSSRYASTVDDDGGPAPMEDSPPRIMRNTNKALQLPDHHLSKFPTTGPRSLATASSMPDEEVMDMVREFNKLERPSAAPRFPLADTPGLSAIKAAWDAQVEAKKHRPSSARGPQPPSKGNCNRQLYPESRTGSGFGLARPSSAYVSQSSGRLSRPSSAVPRPSTADGRARPPIGQHRQLGNGYHVSPLRYSYSREVQELRRSALPPAHPNAGKSGVSTIQSTSAWID